MGHLSSSWASAGPAEVNGLPEAHGPPKVHGLMGSEIIIPPAPPSRRPWINIEDFANSSLTFMADLYLITITACYLFQIH